MLFLWKDTSHSIFTLPEFDVQVDDVRVRLPSLTV
jgi:hypothetical protein